VDPRGTGSEEGTTKEDRKLHLNGESGHEASLRAGNMSAQAEVRQHNVESIIKNQKGGGRTTGVKRKRLEKLMPVHGGGGQIAYVKLRKEESTANRKTGTEGKGRGTGRDLAS